MPRWTIDSPAVSHDRLAKSLARSIDGDAWYGSSLETLLKDVSADDAAAHPIDGAHSIHEIVRHVASWIDEVASRLEGHAPVLPDDESWPKGAEAWRETRAALTAAASRLEAALARFPDDRMGERVGTRRDLALGAGVSFETMLLGLAQHNAYHGGQVALLVRALGIPGRASTEGAGRYSEQDVLALARRAYEEGEASFEVSPESCALLVIDMQDEFVKPGWTPYWVPEATRQVPRVKALVEVCRARSVPVIFTAFGGTHLNKDRPESGAFMPNRFPASDPEPIFREGRIWHELAPRRDEIVILKPSYGAFYDTPLQTILTNLGRNTVIICGTLTNFCCGTTARQAYERGFRVLFGSDVTATDDPSRQEAELAVLRKGFARVLTCDEILALLAT